MKAEYKAILASVLVVALCLTAVSGVTYSWFSDTETGEIKVTSAVIDIDGMFSDPTISLTNSPSTEYTPETYGTAATVDDDELNISYLQANRTITSDYTITNKSTVNSLYRLYISVPEVSDSLLNSAIKFYVSGSINGHTLDGTTPITFNNHLGYAFGDATSGIVLPKNTATGGFDRYDLSVKVVTNEGLIQSSLPSAFTISMVSEAYQVDYQYTEPVFMTVSTNKNTAVVSGTTATTFSANTVPTASSASSTLDPLGAVSVTFPENAMRSIDEAATGVVTLDVDVTDAVSSVSSATLELSLTDSGTGPITSFGGETVTVTVVVPFTGPLDITYNGTLEEQPDILSIVDNGDGTSTVTFQTTHFSGFDVIELDMMEARNTSNAQYSKTLVDAVTNATADQSVVLLKDVTMAENTSLTIDKALTIDLAGYTLKNHSGTDVSYQNVISIASDGVTIKNGSIEQVGCRTDGTVSTAVAVIAVSGQSSNITLNLTDLDLKGIKDKYRAATVCIYNNTGNITLNMKDCVAESMYDVNIREEGTGKITASFDGCDLKGWDAVQLRHPGNYTFKDCTLTGISTFKGTSNDFAVVNITNGPDKAHGEWKIDMYNTVITAIHENGNTSFELLFSLQYWGVGDSWQDKIKIDLDSDCKMYYSGDDGATFKEVTKGMFKENLVLSTDTDNWKGKSFDDYKEIENSLAYLNHYVLYDTDLNTHMAGDDADIIIKWGGEKVSFENLPTTA